MKVLIACEYSGTVRDAFTSLGHDATSCDLLSSETKGKHYQGSIWDIINDGFDLMVAFPPCTHLAASGAPSWGKKQADGSQAKAMEFFLDLIQCTFIHHIAVENPTGIMNTTYMRPNQIINPFQFGEPYRKRTCLWLKNLPLLTPTKIIAPEFHWTSNNYHGGKRKDGTRKKSELPVRKAWDSGHERSRSFTGIAKAMAEQWGSYMESQIKRVA